MVLNPSMPLAKRRNVSGPRIIGLVLKPACLASSYSSNGLLELNLKVCSAESSGTR